MIGTALVDALLAGPRGRRMLLEFALASESGPAGSTPLNHAVFWAVRGLEPGGQLILFKGGAAEPDEQPATATDVARELDATVLAEPTPHRLRAALAQSVDRARYWQEPDGGDRLAATEEMRRALRRVAEHVASSAASWWEPAVLPAQWAVHWDDERIVGPTALPEGDLSRLRDRMLAEERRAQRERPSDPAANMSGEWWSTPHWPGAGVRASRGRGARSPDLRDRQCSGVE